MGHPRKHRKKYSTPLQPWNANRITEEKQLRQEYGLTTKKEIWRAESLLRKIKSQVKSLIARTDEQAKIEEKQLMERLAKLNLISKNAKLDDVLSLNIRDVLNRRLQTMLYNQKLARTINQARQFIIHGHIFVGEKKVNVPSYYVHVNEEDKIGFSPKSPMFKIDHLERFVEEKKKEVVTQLKIEKKEVKKEAKKKQVKKEK